MSRTAKQSSALPTTPIDTGKSVVEVVPERGAPHRLTLLLDGAESSFIDTSDPGHLEFEYMQHIRAVLDATWPERPLRVVHLGGGACALPRALDHDRPGSRQLVIEYDGVLAQLVREWFELPRSPAMRLRVGEARQELGTIRPGSVDVVVRDVFVDAEVPHHVMTEEFAREVAAVVGDRGVYCVNLTDRVGFERARRDAAALMGSFGHLLGICEGAVKKGRRLGNVVLVASQFRLDQDEITRQVRSLPFPVVVMDDAEVRRLGASTRALHDPQPETPGPPAA